MSNPGALRKHILEPSADHDQSKEWAPHTDLGVKEQERLARWPHMTARIATRATRVMRDTHPVQKQITEDSTLEVLSVFRVLSEEA